MEMEQIPQTQQVTVVGEQPPIQTKSSKLPIIILTILLVASLAGLVYFYFQNQSLKQQLASMTPVVQTTESTPSPTPSTTPSDDISDWKTYNSEPHRITFSYPPSWEIETDELPSNPEDNGWNNFNIKLTKTSSAIDIILNVDGFGGMPKTYEGKEIVLGDFFHLYQFYKTDPVNNTNIIGVSDSLTTLGIFDIRGVTYLIQLVYPATLPSAEADQIISEFNQILSTFKFRN